KIMFAHIALLGFQRAGGLAAVFRHANYFTPPFRFCKRSWRFFFTVLWESHAFRRKWSRSELLDFLSFYEKKSMKPSERRLADAFTPEEARQMIKIPRISAIASHHIDFFDFLAIFSCLSPKKPSGLPSAIKYTSIYSFNICRRLDLYISFHHMGSFWILT
ncbi:MAG: hypothetical protein K5787_00965, partial [Lentisphaeria bacterium]|nr:hypothetical protein [Lentisphaeria bacterium]